jgi:hypothetical protein
VSSPRPILTDPKLYETVLTEIDDGNETSKEYPRIFIADEAFA